MHAKGVWLGVALSSFTAGRLVDVQRGQVVFLGSTRADASITDLSTALWGVLRKSWEYVNHRQEYDRVTVSDP